MSSLPRHLFLTACGLGLAWSATIAPAGAAAPAAEALKTAEQACLQSASSNGYKAETGKVTALDAETIAVPLQLSRSGSPATSVTCRFSVSTGLASLSGTASAGSSKASPFAAAKDETAGSAAANPAAAAAAGAGNSQSPVSKKASPYAAAKDELNLAFGPALGRLWLLLVPVGLAAGSYVYLRQRDDQDLAA